MFFQITDHVREIKAKQIDRDHLTAGYLHADELEKLLPQFGFVEANVQACRRPERHFRSAVTVYEDYTFTQLRIAGERSKEDDCVALFVGHNLLLVVDVEDHDSSTRETFRDTVQHIVPAKASTEKLLCAFLDALLSGDVLRLERMRTEVTHMEESVLRGDSDPGFNLALLDMKKQTLRLHNYYNQLLDIAETAEENDNDVLDGEELIHVSNLTKKVTRLREDVDGLDSALEHLQDAYSASLDLQMNHTMKVLTVITTIFFPLTIIVGWYGMNFTTMPELRWRFGYLYVIILSIAVVALLVWLGKRRKWL